MKKILLGLVVLVVVAIGGFIFFFGQIASGAVERGATAALGVPVNVGAIVLRPLVGQLYLTGLEISNPPGFDNPYFLTMDSGEVDLNIGSLFSSGPVEVMKVELSEVEVTLERARAGTNYGIILNNTSAQEETGSEETGAIIDEFLIRDINAKVRASPIGGKLSEVEVVIPEIRMTNIGKGSENGAEMAHITATVTQAILAAVAKKSGSLPGGVGGDLARSLGKVKVQEEAGGAKKLLEGIGGLFKKDDD